MDNHPESTLDMHARIHDVISANTKLTYHQSYHLASAITAYLDAANELERQAAAIIHDMVTLQAQAKDAAQLHPHMIDEHSTLRALVGQASILNALLNDRAVQLDRLSGVLSVDLEDLVPQLQEAVAAAHKEV